MKDLCLFCGIFIVEYFIYFLTRLHLKHFTSFLHVYSVASAAAVGISLLLCKLSNNSEEERNFWQKMKKGERDEHTIASKFLPLSIVCDDNRGVNRFKLRRSHTS